MEKMRGRAIVARPRFAFRHGPWHDPDRLINFLQAARVIEQTMVFALGFLLAGLLTLAFLPALWRRAARLSRRRLEMQLPLSMDEIVAGRDQLRAEFARDRRRTEQALEALQQVRAKDMAELGRRAAAIAALDDENASLRMQLSAAISPAGDIKVQAGQSQIHFDVLSQTQELEIKALEAGVESLRLVNAALDTELVEAHSKLEQANAALAALQGARGDMESSRGAPVEGDDLLRKAIVDLGAEMLRVASFQAGSIEAFRGAPVVLQASPANEAAAPDPRRVAAAGE